MNRGGLETMLMNYYRQIDRNKIQFDFMVHREVRGHYDNEIEDLGGKIYRMPQIRPGNYRKYFKLLNDFFSENKDYTVVHSHINENSSFVLRAAKLAGVSGRIAHSHTSDLGLDYKFPFRLFARITMKDKPNMYFACSQSAAKWLFGKGKSNSGEVIILKNAINLEEFKYNEEHRNNSRKELNVNNKLVIGHVGRFHKSKNHDYLIDVFKEIHERRPDSMLMLVGEGEMSSTIARKVEKLGLTSAVLFLGLRGDIPKLMQAMDLFVFPSFFEGAPVAMVEAQAAGLKCFVSNTISSETNLTGLVQYLSLKESPSYWAEKILSIPPNHEVTSEYLRKNDYDIVSMTEKLTSYYMKYSLQAK